jgi:hypothetical protein
MIAAPFPANSFVDVITNQPGRLDFNREGEVRANRDSHPE